MIYNKIVNLLLWSLVNYDNNKLKITQSLNEVIQNIKMLGDTIPILKFAKDWIEECGGRGVIMNNLRMAMVERMKKV